MAGAMITLSNLSDAEAPLLGSEDMLQYLDFRRARNQFDHTGQSLSLATVAA
jgi:hypothetical protein